MTNSSDAPRPSAARNSVGVFITDLSMFALRLGTAIWVMKRLGPDGWGSYVMLLIFGHMIIPLSSAGLVTSIPYHISSGAYRASRIGFTCVLIGMLHGGLAAAVIWGLWTADWFGTYRDIPAQMMIGMLLLMPLQGGTLMLMQVYVGDDKFRWRNRLMLSQRITLSILLIVLVIVCGFGPQGAVTAFIAANTALFIATVAWFAWCYRPSLVFDRHFAADGYRYGVKAWFGNAAERASLRIDQLLLSLMNFSPGVLGVYNAANTMAELAWMPLDSLGPVLLNRISSPGDPKARDLLFARLHRVAFCVMGLGAFLGGIAGYWLIPIVLGEKYAEASLFFALLIPGVIARNSTILLNRFFMGSGTPTKSSMFQISGAMVGLPLYMVLIPNFGPAGSAVASTCAYVTATLAANYIYRRTVDQEARSLYGVQRDDFTWMAQTLRSVLGSKSDNKSKDNQQACTTAK